jgi:hypothetical protein
MKGKVVSKKRRKQDSMHKFGILLLFGYVFLLVILFIILPIYLPSTEWGKKNDMHWYGIIGGLILFMGIPGSLIAMYIAWGISYMKKSKENIIAFIVYTLCIIAMIAAFCYIRWFA